jgi:CBS domain-containing protein
MSGGGFRHLIVLGSNGQVVGVLSMRDLLLAILRETNPAVST